MRKSDLIKEVMSRAKLRERDATRGVEAILEVIAREVSSGKIIRIRGLGSLQLKDKRRGFTPPSPNRRASKPIPEGKVVIIKPSRKAIENLNPELFLSEPSEPVKLNTFKSENQDEQKLTNPEIKIGGKKAMSKEKENEHAGTEEVTSEGGALGLDIGTSRLVLAGGAIDKIKTQTQLNAFITVPHSKFTENILKQNKITYYLNGSNSIQVYGNEAGRFANVFNIEVRRPMMSGTLNPNEEQAMPVIQEIIKQLLKGKGKGETLRFSVPGPGRDGSAAADLVYHEAMLKKVLDEMGYVSKGVNEGMAVVFAELEKENFTGIGISCGGGMCNVALAFMSIPVMTFSIGKAGDYIDRSASSVTGDVATRIRMIKEEGLDLSRPAENKYENALHIYYEDVVLSLVESVRSALSETKNMPAMEKAIPIVLAGGTAAPKGFLERFQKAVEQDKFPLPISEIRMAKDPLTTTARGCLIAALYDA
ncbi:MAG: HU family DNA-binding protein [Acidobacteriota bacterium]